METRPQRLRGQDPGAARSNRVLGFVWISVAGVGIGSLREETLASGLVWLLLVISCGVFVRSPPAFRLAAVAALALLAGLSSNRAGSGVLEYMASNVPTCSMLGDAREQAGKLGTIVGVRHLACDGHEWIADAGSVIVDDLEVDTGSTVLLEGWLLPFPDDSWGGALARTGADVSFDATRQEVAARPTGVLALAAAFKSSLRRSTSNSESEKAGLVRGLTIGDTSSIDPATEDEFRRTGLAHLVAVSGSNVAIVLGAIVLCVRRLRPLVRTSCCVAALAFYVTVVGPEPSVLRAAAMGAIAVVGLVWGHRADPLNALGLALLALIIVRPGLTTSVGLHLSAAATLGLVLWARPLAEWLGKLIPDPLAWGLGATVAAQMAVAPIMIVVFGEISLVAPVANVLALPAVAPATVLGLCGAVVGLFFRPFGRGMGAVACELAGWVVFVADRLARLSWASIECDAGVGWTLAGLTGAAAAVTLGRRGGGSVQGLN